MKMIRSILATIATAFGMRAATAPANKPHIVSVSNSGIVPWSLHADFENRRIYGSPADFADTRLCAQLRRKNRTKRRLRIAAATPKHLR